MFKKSLNPVEFEISDINGQKGLFDGAVKVKVTPVVTQLDVQFEGQDGDSLSKDGKASSTIYGYYNGFGDLTKTALLKDCLEKLKNLRTGRRYC